MKDEILYRSNVDDLKKRIKRVIKKTKPRYKDMTDFMDKAINELLVYEELSEGIKNKN